MNVLFFGALHSKVLVYIASYISMCCPLYLLYWFKTQNLIDLKKPAESKTLWNPKLSVLCR
jgi:hypothetical protein